MDRRDYVAPVGPEGSRVVAGSIFFAITYYCTALMMANLAWINMSTSII